MKSQTIFLILLVLLLLVVQHTAAKKISKIISAKQLVTSPHTIYVARFGISNEGANITVKFRILDGLGNQLSSLRLGIVHSERYYEHKSAKTCEQKQQLYHESYQLKFFDATEGQARIRMGKDKNQHLSFLYVYTCETSTLKSEARLSVDVIMNNQGLGMEEYGIMLWPYAIMLATCLVVIVKFKVVVWAELQAKKSLVALVICGAFLVFCATLMIKFMSILSLMSAGQGIALFDAIYAAMKVILEVILSSILISIAWGWLLNNLAYRIHFVSIVVIVSAMNILSELLADQNRQQITHQHLYQGQIGKIVLVMRILSCVAFISGCVYVSMKSSPRRQSFINTFAEVGSVFLLANIIALVLSKVFSHSYRHGEVIPILEDFIQLSVCGYMSYMFAYPKESKAEYEEIGIFGFQENDSMIELEEPQSHAKNNGKIKVYEGKDVDLI